MIDSLIYQSQEKAREIECFAKGVLRLGSIDYPEKLAGVLGNKAPSELFYMGNLSLLNENGIGFCGSRKASVKGLQTARDCAEQVSSNGSVVISGYAAGVDIEAHKTALASGGKTIIVLPEGIDHFKIKTVLKDVWDWSRALILSQCKPHETWKAYHAMNRNSVIIGLSQAMIVIEAQDTGGTFEAGKASLKLNVPLFVAEYEDMLRTPGNGRLLQMGGISLKKSRSEGRAKLNPLFSQIKSFVHESCCLQQGQLCLI